MRSFKPVSKSHELGLFGRVMLYGAPFVFFIFLVVTANKRGGFMRHSNSHLHSKYGGQHQFLFMAMLHQPSSPLYNYICKHDDISCVGEPGLGQKVQSLYESDTLFGGPNRFGLENRAKLDEFDIRNTASNRRKLFSEWARYWDVSRSVLMEYSGSDILRLKFLNAMFPQGERFFVVAVRHPAAAFFDRWPRGSGVESKLSINQVVEHWLECFESLRSDLLSLDNVIVVDLDLLKQHPQRLLNFLFTWLEVDEPEKFKPILSSDKKWREDLEDLPLVERQALINAFEHRVAAFGYSMKNLTLSPSLQATTTKVGVPVPSLATISTLQHDDVVELLISSQQRAHDVVDAKDLQHLAAAPVGDDVAVNETPEDVLNWRGLTVNYRISF